MHTTPNVSLQNSSTSSLTHLNQLVFLTFYLSQVKSPSFFIKSLSRNHVGSNFTIDPKSGHFPLPQVLPPRYELPTSLVFLQQQLSSWSRSGLFSTRQPEWCDTFKTKVRLYPSSAVVHHFTQSRSQVLKMDLKVLSDLSSFGSIYYSGFCRQTKHIIYVCIYIHTHTYTHIYIHTYVIYIWCRYIERDRDRERLYYEEMVHFLAGWEVPQTTVCKLETQESQWCSSVQVQKPENQGGQLCKSQF